MKRLPALLLVALAIPAALVARVDNAADQSMRQFLAKERRDHTYRATRRLEAQNRDRSGWLEAVTDYSPVTGLRYQVTAEGGSSFVRDRVLRAVLDSERDLVARRQPGRIMLAHANYTFRPKGLEPDGLAAILVSPKREDHALVEGTMFLRPVDGELVRLEGRLVKNPSFWVKRADITRTYDRVALRLPESNTQLASTSLKADDCVVMPVALDAKAQLRFFGPATFRMTYTYSEIDGRPVPPSTLAQK
jgi:hypothetical protein